MAIPYNGITGKRYGGKNEAALAAAQDAKDYVDGAWFTFLQAKSIGANVRVGQKGTTIYKVTPRAKQEGAPPVPKGKEKNTMRRYTVFNVAQIENLPAEGGFIRNNPFVDDAAFDASQDDEYEGPEE